MKRDAMLSLHCVSSNKFLVGLNWRPDQLPVEQRGAIGVASNPGTLTWTGGLLSANVFPSTFNATSAGKRAASYVAALSYRDETPLLSSTNDAKFAENVNGSWVGHNLPGVHGFSSYSTTGKDDRTQDANAKVNWNANVANMLSGISGLNPVSVSPIAVPQAGIAIDLLRCGFTEEDITKFGKSVVVPKVVVEAALITSYANALKRSGEIFKFESLEVTPECANYRQSGAGWFVAAYGAFPGTFQSLSEQSVDVVISFEINDKTGAMMASAASTGGGAEEVVSKTIDDKGLWEAALKKVDEYNNALASAVERAKIGLYNNLDYTAYSVKDMTFYNESLLPYQKDYLNDWWENYRKAFESVTNLADATAVHKKSGSELGFEEWKADRLAELSTSNPTLWENIKSGLGSMATSIGDYVSKWSPSQWMAGIAGGVALSTASRAPAWLKYVAIGGALYLVLR